MKKRFGTISISIATVITIGGAVAASILWIIGYVNSAVAPVQAQTQTNATDIRGISTDITWIKQALTDNGVTPKK